MQKISLPTISIWLPVVIGILVLPIPLVGNFHIESALVASLIGSFWAGIISCKPLYAGQSNQKRISSILSVLYLAGLPLFIFALFTGCFSWHGLGFWILYPIPSVLFGYALGRMFRVWQIPYRIWLTVFILLFIAVAVPLIQFFNFPQVYFFNHVWGGWPGPIYDETITVSWSLFFFRCLTLLWASLFWFLPFFGKSAGPKIIVVFCMAGLILGYAFLPRLGIISPRSYIQKQLGGVMETPHFIIYYEKKGFTRNEIKLIALEHEFYFQEITEALNINDALGEKIESYLYANVWQKNQLTGAKYTSYVPVWLEQDQLHIAKQQLESLKHELVHVLAKHFGNKILNASWSIGLVEGLAVALAPNVSPRTTIHQIVAAEKPWPSASALKNALSLTGFYSDSPGVSYTVTGSFVKYLLNHYPESYFKTAYKTANVEKAYPQTFRELVKNWHHFLTGIQVNSLDQQIAARLFSIPSLFEKECPHVLSPLAQHLQNYRYYLIKKDTSAALRELDVLHKIAPGDSLLTYRRIFLNLKTGNFDEVLSLNVENLKTFRAKLLYADALALKGKWNEATKTVRDVIINTDSLSKQMKQALHIRSNKKRWLPYLKVVYQNKFYDIIRYKRLSDRLQLLLIQKTIEQERWHLFTRYSSIAIKNNLNRQFFGLYLKIIHYLGIKKTVFSSKRWIEKVSLLTLQKRFEQRLQKEIAWIKFIKSFD